MESDATLLETPEDFFRLEKGQDSVGLAKPARNRTEIVCLSPLC